MSLRRCEGFRRYALAVQYHGGSFLGFSFQGDREDCIFQDGTDLRGYRSVEGRIREALGCLFDEPFDKIQVSSRTDRGVHALKNTLHVDILHEDSEKKVLRKLHRGLNYFLTKQTTSLHRKQGGSRKWRRAQISNHSISDEVRILAAKPAPNFMNNPYSLQDPRQPSTVDWNARFSATQRTYVYRILNFVGMEEEWGVPWEWDRSWRVRTEALLDTAAMQQAASFLEGTHDFSSFRAAKCQRQSPVVTVKSIRVQAQPYGIAEQWGINRAGLLSLGGGAIAGSPQMFTIQIVGDSFLYRQVRNMVACLVDVGRQNIKPEDLISLLEAKKLSSSPGMAPAHGLFLVDVQHGDFEIL